MSKSVIYRLLLAICISILLSSLGLSFSSGLLQSIFTVLGIAFSIAMSLLISIDLSKIFNRSTKKNIKQSIRKTRNHMICDFCISTLALFLASTENLSSKLFNIGFNFILRVDTCAVCIVCVSFIYEIYNFTLIQKLNEEIADRIMDEEIRYKNKENN